MAGLARVWWVVVAICVGSCGDNASSGAGGSSGTGGTSGTGCRDGGVGGNTGGVSGVGGAGGGAGDTASGGRAGQGGQAGEGTGGSTTGGQGGAAGSQATTVPPLAVQEIVSGRLWEQPVFLRQFEAGGDLYVVEQTGRIWVVCNGAVLPEPFLDLRDVVSTGFEDGLLGLAFHPDYANNGRFFVFYTEDPSAVNDRRNVVAEYARASSDPPSANPVEVRRLVEAIEPLDGRDNHNGGMIEFGPDGFLYVGIGDGGAGGDPDNNGLRPITLFGSILRLDVDNDAQDFAAAGNPFSSTTDPAGQPQVFHFGLRNPWRFSFDRATGDLYIGDVGQNQVEEISFAQAGQSGLNFGWSAYEGNNVFNEGRLQMLTTPHVPPIDTADHSGDPDLGRVISITGGYVYRGQSIRGLQGFYLYGDYGTDRIAAFREVNGVATDRHEVTDLGPVTLENSLGFMPFGLASFAEDAEGELYLIYLGSIPGNNGRVFKVVAP